MHLWRLNDMKVMVTLWTLIVLFFVVLVLSLMFTIEPNNLEKSYSEILEKHDQTSIYLTMCYTL